MRVLRRLGQLNVLSLRSGLAELYNYIARVLSGGGVINSQSAISDFIAFYKNQGLYTNTLLLVSPLFGYTQRTSTIYRFFSKLFDIGRNPLYVEKITNGDFSIDDDPAWSKDAGWTILNGVAHSDGLQTYNKLYQLGVATANKWCTISFEIKNYVSGTLRLRNEGTIFTTNYTANGVYTVTIQMVNTGYFGFTAYSAFVGSIDNVSVIELEANDLYQTTELSQPYQSGNIAPNEVLSMQNPNGDARFMTHPTISFADNQAWSVTWTMGDNYNSYNNIINLFGKHYTNALSKFCKGYQAKVFSFINESGSLVNFNNYFMPHGIGKNIIYALVANGSGSLALYVNGVINDTVNIATNFVFDTPFSAGFNDRIFNGKFYYYRIQSGAMTATQVLAEYNKLRTYIPEIETVQIGSKYITSSNFQAVATPAGNVIQEMQTSSAVEKITNAADREFSSDTGFWVKGISTVISGGAVVCTNQSNASAIARANLLTIGKWYKFSVNVTSITSGYIGGICGIGVLYTTAGVKTYYFKAITHLADIGVYDSFTGSFDNVSIQELNWSNATEIYDAVYAATSGTAAEKHYAAVKEAAMWCSYDNSTANQAIYGKLYNDYAVQLLKTDMAAQNFGYHIATEAEKTEILAAYTDANDLKKEGTDYWDNALGTNASGLTLLGTGCRMPDGSFASIKKVGGFATSDGNTFKQLGLPVRLVKD